ncbi:hypothetical protein FHT67_001380 [Paenibacillus sp. BK720]|nr:hypothetical protein [Paenibacillus sp. BK720]
MATYVEDALEIIRDNFFIDMKNEIRTFGITVRLFEVSNNYMTVIFNKHKSEPFLQVGDDEPITYEGLIQILGDTESNDSIYNLSSTNTLKNCISIFEHYIKEILEYLLNMYPHHLFEKKEKIELSRLLKVDSLEELKEQIIREKIINLSYGNLTEMIDYIKKEFNVDFEFKPGMIEGLLELTLIRNLFVHNKGIVNEKFIEKINNEEPMLGDEPYVVGQRLIITADSMQDIFDILLHIGDHISKKLIMKFPIRH